MRWRLARNKAFFTVLLLAALLHGSIVAVPTAYGASSSTNVTSHVCNVNFIAPVISDPASGGKTEASSVVVKGVGEPGIALTVFVNGQPKAATAVAGDGNFAVQVPLVVGLNTLKAQEKDNCGNTKDSSEVTVEWLQVSEPTPNPEGNNGSNGSSSPQNTGGSGGVAGLPDTSDNSIGGGEKPPTGQSGDEEAPKITSLTEGEQVSSSRIWVAGTAQPGSIVSIYVNGKEVARVAVGEDGTFGVEVTLKPGENAIKAVGERDGKRIASRTWHVAYIPKVAAQRPDNQWIQWTVLLMIPLLLLSAAWFAYRHYNDKRGDV